MKRVILKITSMVAVSMFATGIMSSCNDDDNSGGIPVIESVRTCDPEKADSLFTKSAPGQMIVIQGRNLANARALYINDQNVTFNPTLNTDHSIIATIPTEKDGFQLTVWNSELSPEIRVETAGGTAVFAFKVLAPTPSIVRVAGRYPRQAGDKLTLYGTNFLDVERVYFTDVNPRINPETGERPAKGNEVDVEDFTLKHNRYFDEKEKKYVTDSEMSLTLPALPYTKGFIVVQTPQGNSVMEYASLPPAPILASISSDMPVPGSRVTLKGSYFIDVTGIKFGDEIMVDGTDIDVADNESEMSFIMPAKPSESTTISIVTPGGESNKFKFFRYSTLLFDFDNADLAKDCNWSPNAKYVTATPDAEPYISDGRFGLFDCVNPSWNYWGTMIMWDSKNGEGYRLPSYEEIPADTPTDQVYLMFECYNKSVIKKNFNYKLIDKNGKEHEWNNWTDSKVHKIPEFQDCYGDQKFGEWYNTVVPLSLFAGFEGKTYQDVVNARIYRVRFMLLNNTGEEERVFIGIDNVRISTIQRYTPEE